MLRLSKLMVLRGICSRREADDYIERGLVSVNGETVRQLGTKVLPDCTIALKKQAEEDQNNKITILLNKPLGYVSCQPEEGYTPAIRLLTEENRDPRYKTNRTLPRRLSKLAVAGRLDINSKGLLVFTQDGRIAGKLVGSDTDIEKEYLVRVSGSITPPVLEKLRFGLSLDGKPLKRARIRQTGDNLLIFILKEGRNRQIRRMCDLVSLRVLSIKRVRIGKVCLSALQPGMWRFLEPEEKIC